MVVAPEQGLELSLWGIVKQALPLIAVYAVAELGAGAVFSVMSEKIYLIPGLLVMIPAMMDLRGAISSALGARLGSAYHMGLLDPNEGLNDEIIENFKASFSLTLIMSVVNAALALFFSIILGLAHITFIEFLIVSFSVAVISTTIMMSFTYFVAITSAKMGMDPDNVIIPAVATIGDVVVLSLTLVVIKAVFG